MYCAHFRSDDYCDPSNSRMYHYVPKCKYHLYYIPSSRIQNALIFRDIVVPPNPFSTAVPFSGQTTQIASSLSPERDCSPERANNYLSTSCIRRDNLSPGHRRGKGTLSHERYSCRRYANVQQSKYIVSGAWKLLLIPFTDYHHQVLIVVDPPM